MSDALVGLNEWAEANKATGLPKIILPGNGVSISECATKLFELIAPTHQMFFRGGAIMTPVKTDGGALALEIVRPEMARSFFEKFGDFFAWRAGANGDRVLKKVNCSQDSAKALLNCEIAKSLLPRVKGLFNCPIIYELDGKPVVAGWGYDEKKQLLITSDDTVPLVELDQAVSYLLALFDEFHFHTEGDKSRAIASIITPALKMGGFLKRRVPVDVAEADQSQAGKTYRQKIIAAIYNENVSLITNRVGGVGSTDESLNMALVAGRPFIQLDNFRGRFDSPHLEAFITAENTFSCRVPYGGNIDVPPENYFVFLTSNGVNTTRDLANRSNIIRIKKKPQGFAYTKFDEGDLLDRVRVWQSFYLGCVFAVVREWNRQGQLRTDETRHDFREWVQVLDWIVQNIFSCAPLMDGHREAQEKVSNPQLIWLRQLVLAIEQNSDTGRELTATDIYRMCETADLEIPGLKAQADDVQAKKTIGTIMSKLFGANNMLSVDKFIVSRFERTVQRNDATAGGGYPAKFYKISWADSRDRQPPQAPQ